ncbi:16S rRNA (cytosine(967)-C(5))-methyltransferase RsmB [Thalassomonas viridans]|uniref:16S rRNA (cytosine(967)-C(5))-methyltransferase n=1 Tax=Thalassomonas viridans TaxID=137584 RepID=A0AAE9Z2G8_9GAMM|nr:16S rRNA (cytosine(967)-C(5))-methyltransferase RsmB [Thalassomonas viridans]WDE05358.1 16S rRNA (cytosine(967)-C(5))-methyltransferase RsmB [Thalassomonas viridans]
MNIRALAAKCTFAVIDQGRSLADELPRLQAKVEGKDKGLLQEITYGVLRYLPELEFDVRQLMAKPLTGKQRVCHFLILVGIYQIKYTRIPDHAAVSETVAATGPLKNRHLKGLINGVLRNYQRKQESSDAESENKPDSVRYNHPGWLLKKLQAAYPEQWQVILAANQQKPPMWLRVNKKHHSLEDYQQQLAAAEIGYNEPEIRSGAIPLTSPVDVNRLPGFTDGDVSVQDGAAQQAARLLGSQSGDHVLDCCAAPGGKTCHILEYTQDLGSVTAIDIEESRLVRVRENLERLKLDAKVIAADAAKPDTWWDNQLFDRILLDAPCSGTGVIRRHPDIKWLRKASDIPTLTVLQQQILKNIWSLLKPGGTLIYATCSILPEENCEQIKQFITENSDAELIPLPEAADSPQPGWQILPGDAGMDGFYYAKLMKKA